MAKSAIQEVAEIDSFDILIPDTQVKLRAKTITLVPFQVRDGKKVQSLIAAYIRKFAEKETFDFQGEIYTRSKDDASFIASVLEDDKLDVFEDLAVLASLCTSDLTLDEIRDLRYDEGLVLLAKIIAMNPDFFLSLFKLMGLSKSRPAKPVTEETKTGESESTD
jgi:hypothetical protein